MICLDSLNNCEKQIVKIKCAGSHIFHRDCLDQWLSYKNTCPKCREQVGRPNPINNEENHRFLLINVIMRYNEYSSIDEDEIY